MSSDDMIQILKVGNKFFGYRVYLSLDYNSMDEIISKGHYEFEASTIEEAILEAQDLPTEYGYNFYNLSSVETVKGENVDH